MAKKDDFVELQPINPRIAVISIAGDGDLILNKMNARTVRELTAERNGKSKLKEVQNVWEDLVTAIHWRDAVPPMDPEDYTEETLVDLLTNNAPCITGFGLKKSFCQAVVRNEFSTYATKFDNAVNVINRLEPIRFAEHFVDESLMSPKRGSPILVRTNRFSGWSADIHISYIENVYSLEWIVNIINYAGFGLGIGSGRSSGYGRYRVTGILK